MSKRKGEKTNKEDEKTTPLPKKKKKKADDNTTPSSKKKKKPSSAKKGSKKSSKIDWENFVSDEDLSIQNASGFISLPLASVFTCHNDNKLCTKLQVYRNKSKVNVNIVCYFRLVLFLLN